MKRPRRVTRRSSLILNSTSFPASRWWSSASSIDSASGTIERNFSIRNVSPPQPHAHLAEQHGTAARGLHRDRRTEQHRAEHDDAEDGGDQIEGALGEQLALAEPRRLDVDERQARDGAGVQARAGDVDDARGEHQVLATTVSAPVTSSAFSIASTLSMIGISVRGTVPAMRPECTQHPTTAYPAVQEWVSSRAMWATESCEPTSSTRAT